LTVALERSTKAKAATPYKVKAGGFSYDLAGPPSFSIFDCRFVTVDLVRRALRFALNLFEITILSALVLATRCANYQDVFVGPNTYFTDADCYARMTRVRMCAEHPGLIVRYHQFENFPRGTTPHTTAPLDYLIVSLSISLKPFTNHSLDLAGALISPLLALVSAWFLWWWGQRMRFRYRWALLTLFAISPILVHGTELGRPDHQSLSMLLVVTAICAEWSLQTEMSSTWSVVSGVAWALAIWVSAYEPLLLLIFVLIILFGQDRHRLVSRFRRLGWICFAAIIAFALLIERRLPSLSIFGSSDIFRNWSRPIGELRSLSPLDSTWFHWSGYLIAVAPLLIWFAIRTSKRKNGTTRKNETTPVFILALLIATYLLTLWQVRWGYFFMSIFAIALPSLLAPIGSAAAVWVAFAISLFPILRGWDEQLWPNESVLTTRIERRNESVQLQELAVTIRSKDVHPFLAPWWISPSVAYWSGQPAVGGSSHESLDGIADSARFFLSENLLTAREILERHKVVWVFAYDSDRVAANSASILGMSIPAHPLCRTIDRTPAQAPQYLIFSGQNATAKIFRVSTL
jgi:hypothetical protein